MLLSNGLDLTTVIQEAWEPENKAMVRLPSQFYTHFKSCEKQEDKKACMGGFFVNDYLLTN